MCKTFFGLNGFSQITVVQIHIHFVSNTGIDNFWKQSFFKSESERENVSTILLPK